MARPTTRRSFKTPAKRRPAFRHGKRRGGPAPDRHIGSIAKRYARKFPTTSHEDLVQEGHLGLLQAKKKFKAKKGTLSTFAHKHVEGAIRRAAQKSHVVRTPEKTLRKTLKAGKKPALTVGGKQAHKKIRRLSTDGGIGALENKLTVDSLMKRLPATEKRLIHLRYRNGQLTLAKAAKRMKKSTAAVHGLEKKALARLRKLSMGSR